MQFGQLFKSNVNKPIKTVVSESNVVIEASAMNELVDRWKRVVNINPTDKRARLQLLDAYANSEQWDEADLLLESLKSDFPKDYHVRLTLARVVQRKDSHQATMDTWKELHSEFPDKLDPIVGLAKSYAGENDAKAALKLVEQAIAIEPADNRAWLIKGKINQKQGAIDEAVEIYHEILKREPTHYEAEANLSSALLKQERYDELLVRLKKAMKVHPEQTSFKMFLFRLHVKLDNHSDALKVIDELLMQDKSKMKIEYYLEKSDLLLKLGRNDEADAVCESALELYPDDVKLLTLYARVGQRKLRVA